MLDDFDEDADAVWEVTRDGTAVSAMVGGHTGDAQRGLVALHFAQDDLAGWRDDSYDDVVWVRRIRPVPEAEPGQAFRVSVMRDRDVEREWTEDAE